MKKQDFNQEEKSAKQKALEIIPAIVAGICLLLGMYFEGTPKVVFCVLAAVIGIGAYIVVLIKELIDRKRKKIERNGK